MKASPFAKVLDSNDEFYRRKVSKTWSEKIRNAGNLLYDGIYDALLAQTGSIPDDNIRRLPDKYQAISGSILYVLAILTLVLLFSSQFIVEKNRTYLEPFPEDIKNNYAKQLPQIKSDSAVCDYIEKSTSGFFLADFYGNWALSSEFVIQSSTLQLTAVGYSADFYTYEESMTYVYGNMSGAADATSMYGVIPNLIMYWLTYEIAFGPNFFTLVGDPATVFDRDVVVGYISNKNGFCKLPSATSLDRNEMDAVLSFNSYTEYLNNTVCMDILNPSIINYKPLVNQDNLKLEVDVISVLVALALNINLLSYQVLKPLNLYNISRPPAFNGLPPCSSSKLDNCTFSTWYFGRGYNLRYVGMTPVYCLMNQDSLDGIILANPYCFLQFGKVYALPIFITKGASEDMPEACSCDSNSNPRTPHYNEECAQFQLIYGLLIMPNFNPITDFSYDVQLLMRMPPGPQFPFFNASFAGSSWGINSANSSYRTKEFAESSFEQCELYLGGNCSMLLFSSFDYIPNVDNNFVTAYGKLVDQPCTNNFLPSKADWQKLIDNPFGPLQESYVTCSSNDLASAQVGFSVAITNTLAIYPIILLVISLVLSVIIKTNKIPVTYTETEKQEVLDAWLVALLQTRDHQLRSKESQDSLKVLVTLVKELEHIAAVDKFFIPSDIQRDKREVQLDIELTNLSRVSEYSNPITANIAVKYTLLNDYELDALIELATISSFRRFISKLHESMAALMKMRFEINGSTKIDVTKESYNAMRGVIIESANLKNVDIEDLNRLFTLDPIKNVIDIQGILGKGDLFNAIDELARVLYIHGKLMSGESCNSIPAIWYREERYSKGVAYQVGSHVIDLHKLHQLRGLDSFKNENE